MNSLDAIPEDLASKMKENPNIKRWKLEGDLETIRQYAMAVMANRKASQSTQKSPSPSVPGQEEVTSIH